MGNLRVSVALGVVCALNACAESPPRYDLSKAVGSCTIGFETEGNITYAMPNRGGAYWVLMTILVTAKGVTDPVTLVANPTDLRMVIPGASGTVATQMCKLFKEEPVLLPPHSR